VTCAAAGDATTAARTMAAQAAFDIGYPYFFMPG
jgi:hypothetical protein